MKKRQKEGERGREREKEGKRDRKGEKEREKARKIDIGEREGIIARRLIDR